MAMNRPPHRSYEFGAFRVDVLERQLWRRDEIVPLTAKVFDVLLALIENPGRTVVKDDLMQRIWADTFVEEGNLNRNISTLRKVLGDDSRESKIIKTIPKSGYRFIADVREVSDERDELLVGNRTSLKLNVWEETREDSRLSALSARTFLLLAGFVVVGATIAWVLNSQPGSDVNAASVTVAERRKALELYEKGRALWETRSGEDLHSATLILEQAVQEDPELAIARSALADAYAFDYRYWQRSEAVAREAISIDPDLGEPHATIGFVKMFWEWKLDEAESELRQAVQLSPDYATAHQWYAINLFAIGSSGNAAMAEMTRALELEPESPSINADLCQALYFSRRYQEAQAQCERTITLSPGFANVHNYLYEIFNASGRYDDAVDTFFKIEELSATPSTSESRQKLRAVYTNGGIRAFWSARIDQLDGGIPLHYRIAQHYARLGDKERTFRHLREAYNARDFEFYLFLADPVFDEFRTDGRYGELKSLLLQNSGK